MSLILPLYIRSITFLYYNILSEVLQAENELFAIFALSNQGFPYAAGNKIDNVKKILYDI